jgi:hypothetical protein
MYFNQSTLMKVKLYLAKTYINTLNKKAVIDFSSGPVAHGQ